MKYLLDSNAWIGWLRQKEPTLVARIKQETPSDILLCSVVLGELIYGAERSGASHRTANLSAIEQLRLLYASVPFDDSAAEQYGRIRADLAFAGTPIGPNDLMIASIALSNNLTLVTHNTVEFSRVPGLIIDDWQLP
jgi:tRNA(fMet)-specific endonuclease VapC